MPIEKNFFWKNSDDNLLKFFICKYGFNKWFKISTLLPNKSYQECKFRWINWLDYRIKKKKWTMPEDIKLANLSKKFFFQLNILGSFLQRNPLQILYRLLLFKKIKIFFNLTNDGRGKKIHDFLKKKTLLLQKNFPQNYDSKIFLHSKFRLLNKFGKKNLRKYQTRRKENEKNNEINSGQIIGYIKEKKKKIFKNNYFRNGNIICFIFFIYKKLTETIKKTKLKKMQNRIQKKGSVLHTFYNRMVFFLRDYSVQKFY